MKGFIQKINTNKHLGLLALILLLVAIPLTLYIEHQQQDIRQHALSVSAFPATITVSPSTSKLGEKLSVSWTIQQNTSNLTGAESLQFFRQPCSSPLEDCAVNSSAATWHAVGTPEYLSCTQLYNGTDRVIPSGSPVFSGMCTMSLPYDAGLGKYIVRMLAANGTTVLGESSPVTVDSLPVGPDDPSISAWPNPCLLTDYGTCSSIISWNVPNATNAADVTVRVKGDGATKSLFANASSGMQKAGWITAAGATFELYVDASDKPVATVFVQGLDQFPTDAYGPTGSPPLPSTKPTPPGNAGCQTDADCGQVDRPGSTVMKCFKYQDYGGTCKPADTVCAQAITTACYQRQVTCTDGMACPGVYFSPVCVDFPNPCVVPPGWEVQPAKKACSGQNDTSCGSDMTCVKGCSSPTNPQQSVYFCATRLRAEAQQNMACPQ